MNIAYYLPERKVNMEVNMQRKILFVDDEASLRRTMEDTLDIAWELFSKLPEEDLKLIKEDFIKKYLPKYRK